MLAAHRHTVALCHLTSVAVFKVIVHQPVCCTEQYAFSNATMHTTMFQLAGNADQALMAWINSIHLSFLSGYSNDFISNLLDSQLWHAAGKEGYKGE